jgi:hypothetical protein
LAGARVAGKGHLINRALSVLDHHDGVGTGGNASAGHDLNAGFRGKRAGDGIAGFDFADATERCSAARIRGVNGIAVARGAVEVWIVAIGGDSLCEDVAKGVPYTNTHG